MVAIGRVMNIKIKFADPLIIECPRNVCATAECAADILPNNPPPGGSGECPCGKSKQLDGACFASCMVGGDNILYITIGGLLCAYLPFGQLVSCTMTVVIIINITSECIGRCRKCM